MSAESRTTAAFTITGIVQGVGFRPFVYRLATELDLDGEVGNDVTSVFVTVQGNHSAIEEFERRVVADAPPLAVIEQVTRTHVTGTDVAPGFRIVTSRSTDGARTLVAPDTAVCDDCLAELFDPNDRRYLHPFITCTNCGPRFTIIRSLPYDRPATTMAGFEMCAACAAEYADPGDRRYHAQPIGCHDCGPRLSTSVGVAVAALQAGQTVAVKGLGGYHLMCDATDDAAVARLRDRKARPDKPFAVMVADLDAARQIAEVSPAQADLLLSPARPIVLLTARTGAGPLRQTLSEFLAPDNPLVGVMLPYTPVHHLLFAGGLGPLVCTSANRHGEPLIYRDADAEQLEGQLCDVVLGHDRPIEVPCDDSVVRVVADRLLPVRRGRGYAPVPVRFPDTGRQVLAVGGEMKSTCCVASQGHGWVSQHIGEQGTLATLETFEDVVNQFLGFYDVTPDIVAVDAHPGYTASRWARRRFHDHETGRGVPIVPIVPIVEVQHHHAHIAAVMAEHELDPHTPVLGIAFDGTGYGTDGTIWGGEVLQASAVGFERVAHLRPVMLPGGDAAIANPYRVALTHLEAAGVPWDDDLAPVRSLADEGDVATQLFRRQLDTEMACVPTSSMGRLFDAVAALIGCRQRISFEAQAAIELELLAADRTDRGYRFTTNGSDPIVFDAAPIIQSIVADLRAGIDRGEIAAAFHVAVTELIATLVQRLRRDEQPVVLTGGVFQNAHLVGSVLTRLGDDGVVPLTHHRVPPNDGGLALGQAFVAAHIVDAAPQTTPASLFVSVSAPATSY